MPPTPDSLKAAFDPATFRAQGHAVVELLADYLARAETGQMPVLPPTPPEELAARWPAVFPEQPSADLLAVLQRVLAEANHFHHPRCVGHQVAAPLPSAALLDLVTALLNNGMAVYETGPGSTVMERAVLAWMAAQLGFSPAAGGVLTSGGSAGNLTALLAARQAKAGFDAWQEGSPGGPPLAILVSEQAHYCVERSARIMGLGAGGVVKVPADAAFRLRPDALPAAFDQATRAGRKVIAVAASACSTATGTFDPLDAIADFCEARNLWLHVDGAHGAAAALSPRHRTLLRGVERADSVVWDAHKMMMIPALATAVLFRDGRRAYEAFAQEASYLFDREGRDEWNLASRTLECTKRMIGTQLYAALAVHGTQLFADQVARCFDLGKTFARLLRAESDFELAVEPDCNIVCFRHAPAGAENLDTLQERIRRRVLAEGAYYLVQTKLPRGLYLRVTLINPLTTEAELAGLIAAVRQAARAG